MVAGAPDGGIDATVCRSACSSCVIVDRRTFVSSAYYKLGLTYEALKQPDNARKAFETVVQKYPNSSDGVMAQQALERLKRRDQDEP